MAIKISVYVIGVSLLMLGCAHDQRALGPQTCSSSPCEVPVSQSGPCWPFNQIVVPDEILVSVGRPMTITWKLDSSVPSTTYLNPGKPVEFKKSEHARYFTCRFD